jgi:hypothetical protein
MKKIIPLLPPCCCWAGRDNAWSACKTATGATMDGGSANVYVNLRRRWRRAKPGGRSPRKIFCHNDYPETSLTT